MRKRLALGLVGTAFALFGLFSTFAQADPTTTLIDLPFGHVLHGANMAEQHGQSLVTGLGEETDKRLAEAVYAFGGTKLMQELTESVRKCSNFARHSLRRALASCYV